MAHCLNDIKVVIITVPFQLVVLKLLKSSLKKRYKELNEF